MIHLCPHLRPWYWWTIPSWFLLQVAMDTCIHLDESSTKGWVAYNTYCNNNVTYLELSFFQFTSQSSTNGVFVSFFILFSPSQPSCLSCFLSFFFLLRWMALITLTEWCLRSGYAFELTYNTEKHRWKNKKRSMLMWRGLVNAKKSLSGYD